MVFRSKALLMIALMSSIFMPQQMWAQCMGVAGTWNDTYGYTWTLQQSGTTITGRMNDHEACNGDYNDQWTANGVIYSNGTLSITLTPDYVCQPPYGDGVEWIILTVANQTPGCDTSISGDGGLSNSLGYEGTGWEWSTACDPPENDDSGFGGWAPGAYATAGDWYGTVYDGTQFYYQSRVVYEGTGATGSDSCYFSGSPYAAFTAVSGGAWTVDPSNQYMYDTVGFPVSAVDYYRANGRAPCSATVYQNMFMTCNASASLLYKQNVLGAGVGTTTVTSSRGGVTATLPY